MAKTFKVGDKVRIVKENGMRIPVGTVLPVAETDLMGVYLDAPHENGQYKYVLSERIELVDAKPTKKQRIKALENEVEALKARIEALENGAIPNNETGCNYIANKMTEALKRHLEAEQQTPNQRRKAVIERAKAFVADTEKKALGGLGKVLIFTTKPEYHVNKEKRVVTVLIKGAINPELYGKAIAKCAPGDVFNEHIGKAIALAKAYGLDCPKEFTDAPQPDKVVVGTVAMHTNDEDVFAIEGVYPHHKYDMRHTSGRYFGMFKMPSAIEEKYTILDDTEAQYE